MTLPRTRLECLKDGFTDRDLARQLSTGKLKRLRHGVYWTPEDLPFVEHHKTLVRSTLSLVSPDAVVSHWSAAAIHGLPLRTSDLERVSLTNPSGGNGRRTRCLYVRKAVVDADEWVAVDGMRVTSLARTVSDLARQLPREWGVIAADAALHSGLDRILLGEQLLRYPRWHGIGKAQGVVEFADSRAESPGESLSRVRMAQFGIPRPELQYEIWDGDTFVARSDFAWPEYNLIGEFDGAIKYGKLLQPGETAVDVVMREKRRDENLRRMGFWVVHWDWDAAWQGSPMDRIIRAGLTNGRRGVR
jgi:hypothetical protein